MGKVSPKRREFEIKRKRERRKKLKKLKEKYFKATSEEEKKKIIEKIQKIAPHRKVEEVLGNKLK
jgi:polyribonucleotide nucleotidyltransferase